MQTKHVLTSKTVWVQVLATVSLLVPVVRDWLAANPVEFVSALAAVNVLVRFATSGKVKFFGDEESPDSKTATKTGGTPGGVPLWIVMGAVAGLCFTALPSCAGMPLKATIYTDQGALSYSSKGGMEIAVDHRGTK